MSRSWVVGVLMMFLVGVRAAAAGPVVLDEAQLDAVSAGQTSPILIDPCANCLPPVPAPPLVIDPQAVVDAVQAQVIATVFYQNQLTTATIGLITARQNLLLAGILARQQAYLAALLGQTPL